LQELLDSESVPVGQYNVSFSVDEKAGWTCSWVPRDTVDPTVAEFGRAAKVEEVGYRFTDGVMGITEISIVYKHQAKRWDASAIARGPIKIEDGLNLPFTTELVEFLCARVFSRSRSKR